MTNLYLYGTDEVPEIPAEIIVRRLELLDDMMTEILKVHYSKRDEEKKRKVQKAIKFWREINDK